MNPAKFQLADEQHSIRRSQMMINCNRPSPLKINKGSYLIHKQPSSSNSRPGMASNKMQEQQQQYHHEQQQKQLQLQPIIIYTQSPKIIHTQAHDFMALVQKLTGRSPPPPAPQHDHEHVNQIDDPDQTTAALQTQHSTDTTNLNHSLSHEPRNHDHIHNNNITKSVSCSHGDNDQSSSGLTDENCGGIYENNKNVLQGSSSSGYSPMFSHPSPYYADIPLFTPTSTTSTNFFYPPRPVYRFSDSTSDPSPNVAGAISPSMFKFIKGLPEY